MQVICVDEDVRLLKQLDGAANQSPWIRNVLGFTAADEALRFAARESVDVAVLTIRQPHREGLALAEKLRRYHEDIRLIFLSEEKEQAFDAFEAEALGFGLLPCSDEKLLSMLERVCRILPRPRHRVTLRTIPNFGIWVDGIPLHIRRPKVLELLALLVDRGERGITAGEGVAVLWPDHPGGTSAQALFRMTYKRLADTLTKAGIGSILVSEGGYRWIRREQVCCDLYSILEGDQEMAKQYAGEYLREYSWAEDRNGQLYHMLLAKE